ncbi:translation initiation factor eIF-2B subunit delta isoform X1 [Toxorhynchites rutilus septentrionalis]|uniref:translation initiation factor eIF-2B subunit delta isoform X1 n=1 Tax=Toxorhynchites rutilus septentrionalis TaxID=329112 RepID=UPI002479FBDD|nr:translation initiation factor eIF-2B subunit delta isoform X1 [Toxorhynchites rutilus septentrionalis]XP_055628513.1 translation initiation factor eIF-2B subunit delta isoform X1 [Toxorhynchites rutilus septentrionalis]
MEASGAPPKQKRRKHKSKPQQKPVLEVIAQQPISLPPTVQIQTKPEDKENIQQATELTRQPSKRNRKRNKAKKLVQGSQEDPIPLDNNTAESKQNSLKGKIIVGNENKIQPDVNNKVVGTKAAERTLEQISPVKTTTIFTNKNLTIKDIQLDDIFPTSAIYSFECEIPRRLNKVQPVEGFKTHEPVKSIPGIVDITPEEVFPSNKKPDKALAETTMDPPKVEKSREEIMAEREAKKAAKAAAKVKNKDKPKSSKDESAPLQKSGTDSSIAEQLEKLHISEKPATKPSAATAPTPKQTSVQPFQGAKQLSKAERKALFEAQNPNLAAVPKVAEQKPTTKSATTKAERRALQEAQRASKAEAQLKKASQAANVPRESSKTTPIQKKEVTPMRQVKKPIKTGSPQQPHMVKLFNHLYTEKFAAANIVNSTQIHPAFTKLGLQYAEGIMAGSKARCLAFLRALTYIIQDYETPPEKEFSRGFEEALNPNITFLQKCRPFSVSMTNALKYIKMYARQLNAKDSDSDQKEYLLEAIETYIRDQIEKAEEAISISVQEKIYNGDVILTYGCSSLIMHILEEANRREKNFRVVIVDSRPREQEHEMLRQLVAQGIDCTCVLINAISYVIPEVTKVLLSAHALLANGCVMSRVGTAQIALVAKSYNVPVLVCCETHKFSERVQTDAFVYNEIGNPNDLILDSGTRENRTHNPLAGWETISNLTPLSLHYDVTPPELVTAVVTEVAILPCTSVPVILRIKPSEVGY